MSTPSGVHGLGEVEMVAGVVGVRPEWVLWFEDFAAEPPSSGAADVAAAGAVPVITWEPWLWRAGADDLIVPAIPSGRYDEYLIRWADGLRSLPTAPHLRFAHEFNGDWYPWSPAGGTTPDDFVAAWRYVHDLFQARDASDVQWMWCPDSWDGSPAPLSAWYPGDDYVDVLGIDGYNWGTATEWSQWSSPMDVFEPMLSEVHAVAEGRPLIVAEVGCTEVGGSKAEWIAEFVRWLSTDDRASGFIWFDHDKETDWRIGSSAESVASMARALQEVNA